MYVILFVLLKCVLVNTIIVFHRIYGLAKLGNVIAETLLRTQMFTSLAGRETFVAHANLVFRTQMFPSSVTLAETMFPSLARRLV